MRKQQQIVVVGGGLAGCEAAWQIARMRIRVKLWEMRPDVPTPAHRTGFLAELVCSNSLKSDERDTAQGLLKRELRELGSFAVSVADEHRVPAGKALAVDRQAFAAAVTNAIEGAPLIDLARGELSEIDPEQPTVIATGPLTSDALSVNLARLIGVEHLYFFDAIAPTVETASVDISHAFWGTRYQAGSSDYLNCPLTEAEYHGFREALLTAKTVEPRDFERSKLFEGCLPVEELARRGEMTLAFGPLKPVGLVNSRDGKRPFACVQLRRENTAGTLLSLVGCQTRLKHGEQRRVFGLIPALAGASFAGYGSMHRNTFVNSPRVLTEHQQLKASANVFLAGQLTGVEGYVESIACGFVVGLNAGRISLGQSPVIPPHDTMVGALMRYLKSADMDSFQPMNANFGLLPMGDAVRRKRKHERRAAVVQSALSSLQAWKERALLAAE